MIRFGAGAHNDWVSSCPLRGPECMSIISFLRCDAIYRGSRTLLEMAMFQTDD